jgi:predicted porin
VKLRAKSAFKGMSGLVALVVGLASGFAWAQDTQLYGSLRLSLNAQKVGDASSRQVSDNASRFGMRGSEKLWDGMDAVYSIEYGYSADVLGKH